MRIASGRAAGWSAFPRPAMRSHHVCYFDGATLFAGDAAGVRIQPSTAVLPPTPPPDVDVEAWYRTLEEIERHAPERLALIHFGVADDVSRHLTELRERLDVWAGRVKEGLSRRSSSLRPSATCRRRRLRATSARCRSGSRTRALKRYWDTRRASA